MDDLDFEWLPRAVVYVCEQLAIGLLVVRHLTAAPHERSAAVDAWMARYARRLAIALAAGLACRAVVHTAAVFEWAHAFSAENLWTVGVESRWGARFQPQVAAALVLCAGAAMAGRYRAGWPTFGVGAVGLAAVMPLLGHAGGADLRHLIHTLALHTLHLLAGAWWVGSLGVVASLIVSTRSAGIDLARLIGRFSPIALRASSLALLSGLVATTLYVGALDSLWSTAYGRMLLVKLALVACVVACGWRNWSHVRRGEAPSTRVILAEWTAALAVTVATAVLTQMERP